MLDRLRRPASDDRELTERAKRGDRKAFGQLYQRHLDAVYLYLRPPANGEVYPVLIALPSAGTAGGTVIGWRGNWQGGSEAAALDNNSRAGDLTLFVDAVPANAQPCRRGSGSAEGAVIQSGRPVGARESASSPPPAQAAASSASSAARRMAASRPAGSARATTRSRPSSRWRPARPTGSCLSR